VLQSEYNFCLSLSRPLLLQSEYNFCLSSSRILLPQSECTFCLNPSRPYILPRERERESGQLLIRSILVLLFSFEVPPKKKLSKKAKRNKKQQQQRRGFLCVFFSFVRWCFVITFVSRLASLPQSSLGPAYYHR
jgi:hypothetical protein